MTIAELSTRHRRTPITRRGNTLVLVAGILVLLVIIATSYLSRTQTQRSTSVAQQSVAQREDSNELIAEMLAQVPADALFVWPVDVGGDPNIAYYTGPTGDEFLVGLADSNFPRKTPDPDASRYGVDVQWDENADLLYRIPYNRAPYHTVPFTNWPDYFEVDPAWPVNDFISVGAPRLWPAGPGNQYFQGDNDQAGDGGGIGGGNGDPAIAALLSAESNPPGNPGFNDTRWLRDSEPQRWDTNGDGVKDAFSHWKHLTNIATANNNFRIVGDIADVDATLVGDLSIPVEQWLTVRPSWGTGTTPYNTASGNVNFATLLLNDRFWRQWDHWFGIDDGTFPFGYVDLLTNGAFGAPPNLYKLNDLNGDGTPHNYFIGGVPQDRPESEFIDGTARNWVSRVLADTTGNGYTDSYWFASPTPARGGVRQIVAASIVDNSARLNANVASRFQQQDEEGPWVRSKTRGHTPADLALVSRFNVAGTEVGFFDNDANWSDSDNLEGINYDMSYMFAANRWESYRLETGLDSDGINPLNEVDRLDYWQYAGRHGSRYHPETVNSASGRSYLPFDLTDELELRMFEGQNHPWIFTRFEFAVQAEGEDGMVRASRNYSETNEYLRQLNNRELVRDTRRKLTLYSGARNDLLEPGLAWFDQPRGQRTRNSLADKYVVDYDGSGNLRNRVIEPKIVQLNALEFSGTGSDLVLDRFAKQASRKLDLREPDYRYYHSMQQVNQGGNDYDIPEFYYDRADVGRLNLRERLAPTLLRALTDSSDFLEEDVDYGSYYGEYDDGDFGNENGNLNKVRRLAASYAANILAYRSNQPITLLDRMPLPAFGHPGILQAAPPDEHPLVDGNGNGFAGDGLSTNEANYIEDGALTPAAGANEERSFLPIDPQPFIVEAFVGHVYTPTETVPQYYVPNSESLLAALAEEGIEEVCSIDADAYDALPVELQEQIDLYSNPGEHIIFHRDDVDEHSAIAVVQIANPFDVPIDLHDYSIKLFDNATLELSTILTNPEDRWLPPATDERPTTAIFYAIKDQLGASGQPLAEKWREFLDIDILEAQALLQVAVADDDEKLAPGTLVVNVSSGVGNGTWSVDDRQNYDSESEEMESVTLSRRVPVDYSFPPTSTEWVIVDRMDPPERETFRNAVRYMDKYKPVEFPGEEGEIFERVCNAPPNDENPDGIDEDDPGYDDTVEGRYPSYTVESEDHHWIQWVRATRAWGADLNGNGIYEDHERSPRYVFGDRTVIIPTERGTPYIKGNSPGDDNPQFAEPRDPQTGRFKDDLAGDMGPGPNDNPAQPMGANIYNFADEPNGTAFDPAPWFARLYYAADGDLMDEDPSQPPSDANNLRFARKPTFFDMNVARDPLNINSGDYAWSYPDKGWYGQYSLYRDDAAEFDPATGLYALTRIGGNVRSHSEVAHGTNERFNGVEDPTWLNQYTMEPDGSSMGWTSPPATPLFRHNFAMQMALKNKISEQHWPTGGPPAWFTSLTGDEQDELIRNRDFEQVGEVLNVWLYGHEITGDASGANYVYSETETTFSEFMSARNAELTGLPGGFSDPQAHRNWLRDGEAYRVNKLRLRPVTVSSEVVGGMVNAPDLPSPSNENEVAAYRVDPRHSRPAVPSGTRVLDLFVCDGPGRWPYMEAFHDPPAVPAEGYELDQFSDEWRYYNANSFTGRMTPGLLNINTASPEVLRTLPHMTRMIHESFPLVNNPTTRIAEAIVHYRDRLGSPIMHVDDEPAYAHRGRWQEFFANPAAGGDNQERPFLPGMRGGRGFATIGELALLTQPGRDSKDSDVGSPDDFYFPTQLSANDAFDAIDFNSSWRIDYPMMPDREEYRQSWPQEFVFDPSTGSNDPYAYIYTNDAPDYANNNVNLVSRGSRISTDTVDVFDPDYGASRYPPGQRWDFVSEDVNEANMLLSGISNLVTTRSDTFTIHFRVRSFRQNPVTGVWDATDPEYIVSDVRYVMLVDRSEVNRPSDKPKILYLERLPK